MGRSDLREAGTIRRVVAALLLVARALVGPVLVALVMGAAVLGAVVLGAESASAAQGSVPPEVAAFVSDQLIDSLDDAYGPHKGGTVDFREATPGPITEVYFFTEDSRSGHDVTDPVVPRDEWVVPLDVSGLPVGCAMVGFDPDTGVTHVDDWVPGAPFAAAVASLDPSAVLVRDLPTSSWFSVEHGTARPLVVGTSGVTRPRALTALDLDRVPPRIDDVNPATVRALAALVALTGLAVLAISIPRVVARRRAHRAPPAV